MHTERRVNEKQLAINRRRFIECFAGAGVGAALMPGALAAVAQDAGTITTEMLQSAQRIAGISFTIDERRRLLEKLNAPRGYLAGFARLRSAGLGNSTPPAFVFNPLPPGRKLPAIGRQPLRRRPVDVAMPRTDEELAFLPVTHLSRLIERRDVKSIDLTKLYLKRLK